VENRAHERNALRDESTHPSGARREYEIARPFDTHPDGFRIGIAVLGSERRELMNDDLGIGVRDQSSEPHFVVHVADHRHSAHLLQLRGAILGARECDYFVIRVREQRNEDASDCTCSAGYKYVH
jgi:hypothetical protein